MAGDLDKFFSEIHGAEWRPLLLFKPSVIRELYKVIVALKDEISDLEMPASLMKDKALLDLHVTKAHLSKNRSQVEFMTHVTNALMDASAILEWLYRNKNLKNREGL